MSVRHVHAIAILAVATALSGCGSSLSAPVSRAAAAAAPAATASPAGSVRLKHPVPQQTYTVDAGGTAYTLRLPSGLDRRLLKHKIVKTPYGVVWVGTPPLDHVPTYGALGTYPAEPFHLYLSQRSATVLSPAHAQTLLTLPYYIPGFLKGDRWYAWVGALTVADKGRRILYEVSYSGIGMNQPARNQFRVFDLERRQDRLVTANKQFGGDFFLYGAHSRYVVYDQESPGAGRGMARHLAVYDMQTGKTKALPPSAVHGQVARFRDHGVVVSVQLGTHLF